MPKKNIYPKNNRTQNNQEGKIHTISNIFKSETTHFAIGLIFLIVAVYLLLVFTSYFFTGAADQSIVENTSGNLEEATRQVQNYGALGGAHVSDFFINRCFGFAAYFIILFLAIAGLKLMRAYKFHLWKWFLSCTILMIWFSIAMGFFFEKPMADSFFYPGGLHGHNASEFLKGLIGVPGVVLLLLVVAILFLIYVSNETIYIIRKILHPNFKRTPKPEVSDDREASQTEYTDSETTEIDFDLNEDKHKVNGLTENVNPENFIQSSLNKEPAKSQQSMTAKSAAKEPDFTIINEIPEDAERGKITTPYNPRLDLEHYQFPTLNLLKAYDDAIPNVDMNEQNAHKNRIIEVLHSFGIEISSIKASVGPTITLYEITPAEGVRIARIKNLENDIALNLAALGIRIIAPIPGKGTIGIEVPNEHPQIVPMRPILASKKFQETKMELPVAMGKTITNDVFMFDLTKAPHVLVAGATGQGKSVGLNAIVTSLLYKKHPAELKFVIIDPKKVEFSIYAPIEDHYLAKLSDTEEPILTDTTQVINTLNSLCKEMDTRYDLLKKASVRNIKEYNAKFINRQLNPENGHHFLPYIVVIIDEFGDFIMTAGKDVEFPIIRIAQLARAVGIHMIIATQRPTTNIITGSIKANFPARIAFKVASNIDSRTILDRPGAEQLVGKGDMLFLQGNEPVRVQCAFVDTPEVENVVNHIHDQQGYPTAFILPEVETADSTFSGIGDMDMNKLDPLFEEAARLIVDNQQGSTSLIQRKFALGYNRAGRIMDQLENAGIVGPSQGSKAREVLCMDQMDLDTKLSNVRNK
ncbi:MAG: DNA translocase FtsK 4TM domain-containing protein [Phocaeicola sp.]|uniref:FtsK/SpoIIIE family DNA translocase n=1 Tax=Phocaeicola sp. TaxID=2773926 RepID=UPI003F9FE045